MDELTETISSYVTSLRAEAIGPAALSAVATHLVDAYGCAIAAAASSDWQAIRSVATTSPSGTGASVIGAAGRYPPELAAFANSSAVRWLDFNDTYNSRSGGHPSVLFPGVLAVAEWAGRSGRDAVRAIVVATEVYGALCDAVSLREHGWDAGAFVAIAAAAGCAALLDLDLTRTAHAVALTTTSNVTLSAIRSGTLSAWKGGAEGHAVMNGVLMARLAAAGMTGPDRPFCGNAGFLAQVAGPMDLSALGRASEGGSVLERTAIKFLPVQWSAQAPTEALLRLSGRVRVEDIESITISGNDFLWKSVGGGRSDAADKWDPRTRETADHSIAYLAAVALTDGKVTLDSYRRERILDPALRPLMRKVKVVVDAGAEALPPGRQPVEIVVRLAGGRVIREHCEYPRGHPTKSASYSEVADKFRQVTDRILEGSGVERILSLLGDLWDIQDLTLLGDAVRAIPSLTL